MEKYTISSVNEKNLLITNNLINALFKTVGETTSVPDAYSIVDTRIKELHENHELLKLINIDPSSGSVEVDSKIKELDPYDLGKALKELIKNTGKKLDDNYDFIDTLKLKLKYMIHFVISKVYT